MRMLFKRWRKPDRERERGQGIVEFALILPLLILLLAAACDGGWVLLHHIQLGSLADTLAQSNREENADLADASLLHFVEENYPKLDTSRMTISTQTGTDRTDYYEYVWTEITGGSHFRVPMYYKWLETKVELSYEVPFLTPLGSLLFGSADGSITLHAGAESRRILENESYRPGG